jgi:uncharacterized protein (DUF1810 family)
VSVNDPSELQRFVDAQDDGGAYASAVGELRDSRKLSRRMWFIFPQIAVLGRSPKAHRFAISGMPEARAYRAHPVLGPRLVECSGILTNLPGTDAATVLGQVDAQKLQSSMTLFAGRHLRRACSRRCSTSTSVASPTPPRPTVSPSGTVAETEPFPGTFVDERIRRDHHADPMTAQKRACRSHYCDLPHDLLVALKEARGGSAGPVAPRCNGFRPRRR